MPELRSAGTDRKRQQVLELAQAEPRANYLTLKPSRHATADIYVGVPFLPFAVGTSRGLSW